MSNRELLRRLELIRLTALMLGTSSLSHGAFESSEAEVQLLHTLANRFEEPIAPSPSPSPSPNGTTNAPLPDVVVQAIVEHIRPNEHGSVVQLMGPAWNMILRLLAKDPNALFELTPQQMEELVAASYDAAGFEEVTLTPRSGDLGRDVIAVKRDWVKVRILDQVKAYAPGHRVSANDVRALSGVLHGDRAATKGIVTTTSAFAPGIETDPFLAPLIPYRLELFDGRALTSRLLALGSSPKGSM